MIRITKATANDVTVTTTEKGTASHFLFEFENQMTRVKSYCIQQDTSSFEDRYNQFEITEQASPTAEDGEVELDAGEYKYKIYANSSPSNVDPSGLTELESGICKVTGTTTEPTEHSNNPTWVTYEG